MAFKQPSAWFWFLEVLSNGKVRFLPPPVPLHQREGVMIRRSWESDLMLRAEPVPWLQGHRDAGPGHRAAVAVRGGKCMCRPWEGRAGLRGRILLGFPFLTAFPRAVTAVAQLPVGENRGHRASTCHSRQTRGGRVSQASVQAEP